MSDRTQSAEVGTDKQTANRINGCGYLLLSTQICTQCLETPADVLLSRSCLRMIVLLLQTLAFIIFYFVKDVTRQHEMEVTTVTVAKMLLKFLKSLSHSSANTYS